MSSAATVLRRTLVFVVLCSVITWGHPPRADEGMWTAHDLSNCPVDSWHARGLTIDAADIHSADAPSLTDAIVQLGGGTGSFVSAEGLIVTNHHVAYRAIQQTSDVDSDHLAAGFLAATHADEIPAPGFEGKVLLAVEDVTDEVLGGLDARMSGAERFDAIRKAEARVVEQAEKDRDVFCEVKAFYGGSQYLLYTYFRVKDLRLVYAPPSSIGVYGGEIDNWMWPRHTGDFAFVRAYVGPDGASAEYSEDNVPFHPRRYLTISNAPLSEGDFSMVIGYPGSTRRFRTSHAISFFVDHYYPRRLEYFGEVMAILDEESARGRDVELKLAGTRRSLANSYKNYQGMLDGLRASGLLAQKLEEEKALAEYAREHPDVTGGVDVVAEIGKQFDDYIGYWEQRALLGSFQYASSAMQAASSIYKWAVEREKDDIDRDPGYKDRDERTLRRRLANASNNLDVPTDRRVFAYFLQQLADAGFAGLSGSADGVPAVATPEEIAALTDRVYDGTNVIDEDARLAMFGRSREELLALHDPMIDFVAGIYDADEALDQRYEAYSGALQALRPQLMRLRTAYYGGAQYPDANFTMRLSVGEVKGYSPRDAVAYGCQTTMNGVMEKYTGEEPFDVPDKLRDLYEKRDYGRYLDPALGDLPVCFLTTNDITGGNSGSPVLNGRGELIGLAFDGNYESISADYQFIPETTRAINVDARYILFLLDKFAGAHALMDELRISDGTSG